MPYVPTGIAGLDRILRGGLVENEVYIVQGTPGTGKTILGNQICFNHARQGGKALYIGLLTESYDRMTAFIRPMAFFDEKFIGREVVYLSGFAALEREGLPGLQRLIVEEIRRTGATFAVLDGLFVAYDMAQNEMKFKEFIRNVQAHAPSLGCTILMLTNNSDTISASELAMVDGWIQLQDTAYEWRTLRSLIVQKQRGKRFLRGQHSFRITDEGLCVFPRLETIANEQPPQSESIQRISSGIKALDDMLCGGYPQASIGTVYGPSGSGKTSFGLHFVAEATPDSPALIFGFYETPARLFAKAGSINIDIKKLVEQNAVGIIWHNPIENLVDELAHKLLEDVDRRNVKRLFIDGINAFRQSLVTEERFTRFASTLSNELRFRDVTALYSMENPELLAPEHMGTDHLSAIIDNALLLHYACREGVVRRKMSILKIRDSDFNPVSEEFYISDKGIQFGARPIPEGFGIHTQEDQD